MCGLIGGTGKIESRYLIALGCLSEDRGSDSAGVAWQVSDKLRVAKLARNPLAAFPIDLAPAIRHAAKYHAPLIGHTRQATQGAVSAKNAHPFFDKESHIAWAHNGIIINDDEFGKFDVDSECLIGGIQKRDFSPYHGPIALLWIENGKLHAFRKTNPLFRGVKRGAVYLASEGPMLNEIGCHRVKALKEGFVYSWTGNVMETTQKVPVHEWTQTDYTERAASRWNREPQYFWGSAWHNHRENITWDYSCAGCKKTDSEPINFDRKGPDDKSGTALIPIKRSGGLAESYIERKLEAQEAEEAELIDAEKLCISCQKRERVQGIMYCQTCEDNWVKWGGHSGLD